MKVYRIENSEGVGPYRSDEFMDLLDEMKNAHCDEETHPNLLHDGLADVWSEAHICAFDSMKKLSRWFNGYLPLLLSLGFKVKSYETSEYHYGLSRKQLIFIPNV